MASLTGTSIQSTYDSLLKISGNDALTSSLQRITDGLGNFTPLYLSTTSVEISSGLNVIGSITGGNLSGTNTGDETNSSIKSKLGAASASQDGYLTSSDWSTFNAKQNALGYTPVPTTRTLTINGETYDLSANRSWTIAAGVTSFNTRTGAITLTSGDVTGALGYTPYNSSNPNGYISGITRTQVLNALATGGSPFEFLKSDGSVDTNSYVTFGRTITINGTTQDLSANRTFNVGTVTSVSGTGTVSGLTLTGSVTSSGSLTLGGTLTLTSGQVTSALGYTPVPNTRTLTINGTTFDLTADRSWTISTGVTGSGTAGRIPVFATSTSLGDSQIYTAFDETAGAMIGIGATPNASPTPVRLYVSGQSYFTNSLTVNAGVISTSFILSGGNNNQLLAAGGGVVTAGTNITISGGTISATGGLSGTLTTNYIPKATGSTSLGNSLIFDNGTNVGINTTSPSARLHVSGSDTVLRIQSGTGGVYMQMDSGTSSSYIGQLGTSMYFENGGSERMRITSGGNVGIGTSSPGSLLHLTSSSSPYIRLQTTNGSGKTWAIGVDNAYSNGLNFSEIGVADARLFIANGGNVGIGTSSPSGATNYTTVHIAGQTTALGGAVRLTTSDGSATAVLTTNIDGGYLGMDGSLPFRFATNSTERMRITSGGAIVIRDGVLTGGGGFEFTSEAFFGARFQSNAYRFMAGNNSSEYMRITSAGNVGIGTTNPVVRLQVEGGQFSVNTNTGAITNNTTASFRAITGTSTDRVLEAYSISYSALFYLQNNGSYFFAGSNLSDARAKKDITYYSEPVLDKVMQLKPASFRYTQNDENIKGGFIAQEVKEIFPDLVTKTQDEEDLMGVDYYGVIALLTKAVQELKQEIEELKNR